MAYSIEIDGTPVKYKSINFTKRHPSEDCDEFYSIVEWGATVSQFSAVTIKKDATALFYGLVETINPMWDEGKRYKQLNGRCHKVYVWKKFTERFERGHIDGFFGVVNPSKLAEFLLRCPISEVASTSVFHRIGYGIDLNSGKCSAIDADRKTHPEWCRFRHLGFRWLFDGHHYIGSDIALFVTNFIPINKDFTHEGAVPWLNESDVNYIWINNEVGSEGLYDDYYWIANYIPPSPTDTDGNSRVWRERTETVTNAKVALRAFTSIAGASCSIKAYLKVEDGGPWIACTSMTIVHNGGTYAWYEVAPPAGTLDTVDKINYARLKIVYETHIGGVGVVNISQAKITFDIELEETDYQRTNDWFKIDLGSDKTRVMGVLIESRYSANLYARNYAIETATAAAPTVWTSRATKSSNTVRDILESWAGVTCRYVRIRLTDDADFGWEISQIFVWQSEDPNYDIDGDGTDLTIGAVGSANFADYADTIDPISFGFQRINEALNHICKTAHASYIPWEWWVVHNAAHDFIFKQKRGTDRSGTVIFERGKHIKSIDVSYTNRGTVQRARIIGRGEGKDQDEIASDWKVDAAGIGQVNTFYEGIISDKSVGDKTQADTLAEVYTTQHGKKRVELTIVLNYDPWEGTYEVGDEIKIIDATLSINAKFRLTVIERAITNEPINETTLTLTNSWYDVADLWAEIKRELRNAGLTGTVVADWRGEGGKQNELSAEKMDDIWNAQAQNEEIEPPAEKDDDRWNVPNDGVNNQAYRCDEDFFCIKGSKVNDETQYFIKAILMKDETFEDGWIDFDQSPRFVCEVKVPYEGTDPDYATDWRVGDFCRIWMHNDSDKGFGFTIKRVSGGLEVWSYLLDAGGAEHEVLLADTMSLNEKFRLEARVEWDEKLVKWYYNNVLKGVFALDTSETGNGTNMFPVYVYHATSNPAASVIYWAWLFIYDFRAQAVWEA